MCHPSHPKQSITISRSFIQQLSQVLASTAIAAFFATPLSALAAQWDGEAGATVAGGYTWTEGLNWAGDILPISGDEVIFGPTAPGLIHLQSAQNVNSVTVSAGSFTLGGEGNASILTNSTGNFTVNTGATLTLNASLSGTGGLTVSGGGTLLNNAATHFFSGAITIDGAGTKLVSQLGGQGIHITGVATVLPYGRQDVYPLGTTTAVRPINLQNGGEFVAIGNGANPDGGTKQFIFGSGGGKLTLAAGTHVSILDDAGQIGGFGDMTLAGKGRLILQTQDFGLTMNTNLTGGILHLTRLQGASTTAGTRFSAFASGQTMTLGGGMLVLDNGTVGRLDHALTLNAGGVLAMQGADHRIGLDTSSVTTTLNGGTILLRNAFDPQTARLPRFRSLMEGSGVIDLIPAKGVGANSRLVLERGDFVHTFNGTLVVHDNAIVETHPRNGTDTIVQGNPLGAATVELRGYGSTLDLRDNPSGISNSLLNTGTSNYTANSLLITSSDPGNRVSITIGNGGVTGSTNNYFAFKKLTIGSQRAQFTNNNGYGIRFAEISLSGTPILELASAPVSLGGSVLETAAGQVLHKQRSAELFLEKDLAITTLNIDHGPVRLLSATGAIAQGAASGTVTINIGGSSNNVSAGLLHLDNNGTIPGTLAATNNDRVVNTAIVNLSGGGTTIRLTSLNGDSGHEILGGSVNVLGGHSNIELVKTGVSGGQVALTLGATAFNPGPTATMNFSGAQLGVAGIDTTRVVLPGFASSAILAPRFRVGNEWAAYDTTIDGSVALGVIAFNAYTTGTTEDTWAAGQHLKRTTSATLTANREAETLNLQFTAANSSVALGGNNLSLISGGILTSGALGGITAGGSGGTLTAGATSAPTQLVIQNNAQLDLQAGIVDNTAGGSVTVIKGGTGTLRLTHHQLAVGSGVAAVTKFATPTWATANTGGWVINDGTVDVHRGQFLGAPGITVRLNGGNIQLNEPMPLGQDSQPIPGWGQNFIVSGNSQITMDNKGESNDANAAQNNTYNLGTLSITGPHTLSLGGWNQDDLVFTGANFTGGEPLLNLAIARDATSHTVINGVQSGSGFTLVGYNTNAAGYILGGGSADTAHNTYSGAITILAGSLRLNKANGITAVTDSAATHDIVLNGGNLYWGPGRVGTVNNNAFEGIGRFTNPDAGRDQISDTASVLMLSGTIGEADRINTERWANLTMKQGTLNAGLGVMEIDTVTVSGGAFGINNGGTFKAGKLTLQSGAFSPGITTGAPGDSAAVTTLEIGSGGLEMSGQNITLGSGSSGNFAGAGAVMKLGGNITATFDPLNANSYFQGIWMQVGSSARQYGNSRLDLLGGNRTVSVSGDTQYFITAPITNGGLIKTGAGNLVLQPYQASTMAGGITVNEGALTSRASKSLGNGSVTVNDGGTLRLEGSWDYSNTFTISGAGSFIVGSTLREAGALISESGYSRILPAAIFTVSGGATLASNSITPSSATPAGGSFNYSRSALSIESSSGITGTGRVTLTGSGNGIISLGVNTTSGGLTKAGSGRWAIQNASSYTGTTDIVAGYLLITNGGALGTASQGTNILGGASLEMVGGITTSEPFVIQGIGADTQSGAIHSVLGNNTLNAAILMNGNATLRASSGLLTLGTGVSVLAAGNSTLTLGGAGDGVVRGALILNAGGLIKTGTGIWSIRAGTNFTGATSIIGGGLVLDYTTDNAPKLSSVASLNLGGGALTLQGNEAATTTQTLGDLILLPGAGRVSVQSGTGQSAFLTLGNIIRNPGGTVNFTLPGNGSIATSALSVNGMIGAHAIVGGTDWADVVGGNIAAVTTYLPLPVQAGLDLNHSLLAARQVQLGSVSTQSLKITGGEGLFLGSLNPLTLGSGGVLFTGTGTTYLAGTATISGATAADDMIFHTASGTLAVGTPIIGPGSGSLTKSGAGTLFLAGASSYTGSVFVNQGTLAIVGNGGVHPTALGTQSGNRNIVLNGGTLQVRGSYDLNIAGGQMQIVAGTAGATLRTDFNGTLTLNDAGQFSGSGNITLAGAGRFVIQDQNNAAFGGRVTLGESTILQVNNTASIGGRKEQVITMKPGSTLINGVASGLGIQGMPNDLILEGDNHLFVNGGNRVYTGDISLNGTNSIYLFERDNTGQNRQLYLTGRLSGNGVTLNVHGNTNADPFYLSSGSNDFTGTINLGTNATLEARMGGSLGTKVGAVTINLAGHNSRLLLRHWQNSDFLADVNVRANAQINADRLINYVAGSEHAMGINNLTVSNTAGIVTFSGANNYYTRIAGSASIAGSPILDVIAGSNVVFENGIQYADAGAQLTKRGGGILLLRAGSNHSGITRIEGGTMLLRNAATLANTSAIELRGGELRIDNSDATNSNRLNDATTLTLAGGALRIIGTEATLSSSPVAIQSGLTTVSYTMAGETGTPNPLIFPGIVRNPGSAVNFSTDYGVLGAITANNVRLQPRIHITGQTDVSGVNIIPWATYNNVDFVQYSTALDAGVERGVIPLFNNGVAGYVNDTAATTWNGGIISRLTGTNTTTAMTDNRTLQAIKLDGGAPAANTTDRRVNIAGFRLTVASGVIIHVANTTAISSTTATAGTLTAGISGQPTELIFNVAGGTLEIGNSRTNGTAAGLGGNVIIADNGPGGAVSIVKNGGGTLSLRSTSAPNTFTGGVFINAGVLDVHRGNQLGPDTNEITLAGGTLTINVPDAQTGANLPGFGHKVKVVANSTIILDNNGDGAGTGSDNKFGMGLLTITGPHVLTARGFDSQDIRFNGANFTGTPLFDMIQVANNTNTSTFTLAGAVTGSGFSVTSSGNSANTSMLFQIGNGAADNVPNSYSGALSILGAGANNQPTVELNKAPSTVAVTGDILLQGGTLRWAASNQLAPTTNLIMDFGALDFNANSETVASVTMRGGLFRTNGATTAAGTPLVTVSGNFDATGTSNAATTDGVTINSNSALTILGTLRLNGTSKATVGANAATLNLNHLEMTGTILTQNAGAGINIVRLNGDATILPSNLQASLGNSTDSDTFFELNGIRTFNVADGPAALDLALSSVLRDSTAPVAAGGILKTGPGSMQLMGGSTANSYTASTLINEGSLILAKNAGVVAVGISGATIGDGIGGPRADRMIIRNNEQIADSAIITVANSGLLDLETFSRSETIGALSGSGVVALGPTSQFTISGVTSTTFAGEITGGGSITRAGLGTTVLAGINDYLGTTTVAGGTLNLTGSITGSPVTVNAGGTLSGSGTIGSTLTALSGSFISPGNTVGQLNTGSVTLDPGSTYVVEIASLVNVDRLNVTGTITLGASLSATFIGGFTPAAGDLFFIGINDGTEAVNGTFAGLPQGSTVNISGFEYQISYQADFATNSFTGGNDIALIPEPSATLILLGGLGTLLASRRRKNHA